MAIRQRSPRTRTKKLVSKMKSAVAKKKSRADFGEEGRPADRAAFEMVDLIEAPHTAPMSATLETATVSPMRENIAARRIAALQQRRQAAEAFVVEPTPVSPGAPNWAAVGPIAIPNGQAKTITTRVLVSGRVTEIAVHPTMPSTIYMATARGGVWKTTDAGASWAPLTDNELSLATGAIALAPNSPDTIYAGTGEGNLEFYVKTFPLNSSPDNYLGAGVLKSTTGGSPWTSQGLAQFTGAGFFRIAVHPTNPDFAFAATSNGLFRTVDGGANWVLMTSGLPAISITIIAACDVTIDPSNPNIAYAAFFADGIYRTSNATAATPAWTKLTSVLPTATRRIVIAISPSLPDQVYALFTAGESFGGLFKTTLGTNGATWTQVPVTVSIGAQSSYNLDLNVDPTTPDILYISALSLYKVTHSGTTWTASEIGANLHSDHHCLAFDPTNHLTIYDGSDGGIYKSTDGGMTWDDSINRGMTITQFEFLDQHPTSDAVVFGGTQDNGTEEYRNSEIFYHADEGDGSFVSIDPMTPANVVHGFYGSGMGRSTSGGEFGTWNWAIGPGAASLFYPPFTLDVTNPQNIAFGGMVIRIDANQGTGGWPTTVALAGLVGAVSAVTWPAANRIYAGTTSGQIYKVVKTGSVWSATLISAAPLPSRWVWDIAVDPATIDTIYVALSGFGTPHVWRGNVSGTTTWTAISGAALPDAPVFAIAIRPGTPNTFYAGTDVGVYISTDGGTSWALFSSGLPNTAIYDLQYHPGADLLRAGTHGRGLWERQLNAPASVSDVNVYMRDNVMDSGRRTPSASGVAAAFSDPLRHVALGDTVWWWESADIKIDAPERPNPTSPPEYQMNVSDVNDLTFETKLAHRDPQRGRVARVYVEVHNRGVAPANATVKILHANVFGGALPDLPSDFWTAFPGDGDQTNWKSIGAAQSATIRPGRSTILEWDWTPQMADIEHSCLLAIADSLQDPIPAANKVFHVWQLVPNERHVTQLNLHVVDPAPAAVDPIIWTAVTLAGNGETRFDVRVRPSSAKRVIVALPRTTSKVIDSKRAEGIKDTKLPTKSRKVLDDFVKTRLPGFETAATVEIVTVRGGAVLREVVPPAKPPLQIVIGVVNSGEHTRVAITQETKGEVVGGCTIVVRDSAKA